MLFLAPFIVFLFLWILLLPVPLFKKIRQKRYFNSFYEDSHYDSPEIAISFIFGLLLSSMAALTVWVIYTEVIVDLHYKTTSEEVVEYVDLPESGALVTLDSGERVQIADSINFDGEAILSNDVDTYCFVTTSDITKPWNWVYGPYDNGAIAYEIKGAKDGSC